MNLWKNYNLSIVLGILFLGSWILQGFFQWQEYTNNQQEHNQPIELSGFIPEFLSATFENWQSEYLQLFSFVVLTTFLIHKGSHESKDSDDKIQAQLNRIEKILTTKKAH